LGAIRAEAAAGGRAEIVFFGPLMRDFTDFRSAKFHEICTERRVFVCSVGLLGNNCENLPARGLFSKKNLHFGLIEVNDFRLPAAISPKRLQILESHDRLARLRNVGFPLTPLE